MVNFEKALEAFFAERVDFLLVGGAAGIAHGGSRLTQDLDIVYSRDPENLDRIVKSLSGYEPYLRGAPPGLPFRFDVETLKRGLNFTLTTTLGDLDLLGEITGGGGYKELLPHSMTLQVFGIQCRCLDLEKLIDVKRAAGRIKDLEAIAELEQILDSRA